jgi:hypothetical protein
LLPATTFEALADDAALRAPWLALPPRALNRGIQISDFEDEFSVRRQRPAAREHALGD